MKIVSILVLMVCLVVLVGCASANVDKSSQSKGANATLPKPEAIQIVINTASGKWKADDEIEKQKLQKNVSDWFNELLPPRLEEIAPIKPDTSKGWVVKVEVTHYDPGSVALKMLIGLGSGQSKIGIKVHVMNAQNQQELATFNVETNSGNYSTNAEMVIAGVGEKKDVWRACREIRDYLLNLVQTKDAPARAGISSQ